jgi:hypothetical protein
VYFGAIIFFSSINVLLYLLLTVFIGLSNTSAISSNVISSPFLKSTIVLFSRDNFSKVCLTKRAFSSFSNILIGYGGGQGSAQDGTGAGDGTGGGSGGGAGGKRGDAATPAHLYDITHQPLCLYMEFLCRIFDEMSLQVRRWYLSAIEAANSGLKGKK